MATPPELIPPHDPPDGGAAREHYVVCADDDPEFVKSLELFLPERINNGDSDATYYQFLFFTNPREAIEAVREIRAGQGVLAMVISDQQMPQMKGTTFLAEIRKQCPDCVCVLLTGHAGLDSAITAINERLLDKYMTKPIENDHDFTVSIQHLLQRFRMQRTIENQHRTNQLQHRALAEAYTETQTQAEALAAANERLQVLDRLKSDFLVFVCHELRTPLSALAAIDLLNPGAAKEQQAEVIQIVRDGYARLEEFIQRGLDYVGWIATDHTTSWETINFASLVRKAVDTSPALKVADVDVEVSYPKGNCFVDGSRTDLMEIASILLDNAARFSPRKKWIRVALQVRGDRVVLEVRDRGDGFAPEMAEEIFRPFTIADPSHHRTGCALSLAKAASILKVHRGEIRAASEGHERGASFTVTLPLAGTAGGVRGTVPPPRSYGQPARESVG